MLRPVHRPLVAFLLASAVFAGCGEGKSDEQQVRETLDAFSKAAVAKDYDKLCKQLLAPKLLEEVKQAGLPCEVAMARGLEGVKDPKITIGQVTVDGDSATADVRTSATGQEPSRDNIKLTRISGRWRIASLS